VLDDDQWADDNPDLYVDNNDTSMYADDLDDPGSYVDDNTAYDDAGTSSYVDDPSQDQFDDPESSPAVLSDPPVGYSGGDSGAQYAGGGGGGDDSDGCCDCGNCCECNNCCNCCGDDDSDGCC
jgi:hypothetical protein